MAARLLCVTLHRCQTEPNSTVYEDHRSDRICSVEQ